MRTADFLAALLDRLPPPTLLVSALGRTSEELYRLAPDRTLVTDTMGDVAALSVGVALGARPLPVAGVDTDGSFLMNLSVLTALGARLPTLDNHTLVIVDNGRYESAGGMPSRLVGLDWHHLFRAVGLTALAVHTPADLPRRLPQPGLVVLGHVTNDDPAPDATKPVDGVESAYLVEKYLARQRGAAYRRPAVKT
ncbi:hypothetical protein AWW66_10475 [Micromonospora rosaria]|uniref:Thiamine pyrophosphate enzyme TPP-binding domain-containing protein n=1 Tax=Micromonospora rosaria TaxID=47874 RepID=A0A136PUF7_9ACTN|nr:thiamine pyrophosphate-dependent enzyme [Micromonospora rosaria]KXK62062.1 hypothetical protein AWW66_10475 [Micromonospora rosaria]